MSRSLWPFRAMIMCEVREVRERAKERERERERETERERENWSRRACSMIERKLRVSNSSRGRVLCYKE